MEKNKVLNELEKQGITEEEALHLLKSSKGKPSRKKKKVLKSGSFKYGYFSDPHIGHEKFDKELFERMAQRFNDESLDFIVNPGDHLEGMSGRPGHVYELDHIGYNQQLQACIELYSQLEAPIFGIDGNHDQWFKQKNNNGAIVGEDLERQLEGYTHLGEWEGDLEVAIPDGIVWIKLFHGNDGTAYADSYKIQKLIESFTGGEKPQIVHSGHYHKALALFRRNVFGFESGTLCGQSQFMRGKKLQAHKGFGIVEVEADKNGIQRLVHEWVPDYD